MAVFVISGMMVFALVWGWLDARAARRRRR